MSDYVQVMTTTDRAEHADELARALVDARLAACVQVLGPMRSHYRWKGDVERAEEWLLVIKTARAKQDALVEAIGARHHYDVPEITVTAIVEGSPAYLAWIGESVS
ncbi:MAG: divalent-cation tolerance protein CutA [Actinomycetota bacterium]|nr:divalent-cation tolerance protein CutA [Actinomycetota bacterium]